ncbi:hypothetical protein [Marinobacter sp. DS40M6]|uniref:hypothetical protein n=1 Tax=Marinobacter sp. DS40M6 TaxID=1597776 RepID=UPI00235833CB|nr:hypothetical protein [Marinobacter sp. DS40M6]
MDMKVIKHYIMSGNGIGPHGPSAWVAHQEFTSFNEHHVVHVALDHLNGVSVVDGIAASQGRQ